MSVFVKNVSRRFGNQLAVDDLSFSAVKGQILGFLGPNGAGKTTMMKMITAYLPMTSGKIEVCGYDVAAEPLEVKRNIGYLPENNPLYKDMYVKEYLLTMARMCKVNEPMKRIGQLIEQTGLTVERNKRIGSLSKGFRQRVGLSQALLHDPQVLILDEPTSGLDPNQLVEIRSLIQQMGKEKTLIFSTHIMQEVKALCNRVIIINKGKLVADGPIDSLTSSLQKQRRLHLELEKPGAAAWIKDIAGIKDFQEIGLNKFIIVSDQDIDLRADVFEACVRHGNTIRSMYFEQSSVEDVFGSFTKLNE